MRTILIVLLMTGGLGTHAQLTCGFDSIFQKRLAEDPKFKLQVQETNKRIQKYIEERPLREKNSRTSTVYTIPIVVHVVHTGDPIGTENNPATEQILNTIEHLNKVFSGTLPGQKGAGDIQVQFALASVDPSGACTNGINRVDGSFLPDYVANGMGYLSESGCPDNVLKNEISWDISKYYNIFLVHKIQGGWGGYAYYPTVYGVPEDGIVLLARLMTPANGTIEHELGHALNLFHTFYGVNGNDCPDNIDCTTSGDQVCDTDPVTLSAFCRTGVNECTGTPFSENTEENFMSYTICKNLFTEGQKERMLAAMTLPSRQKLIADNGVLSSCVYNDDCPGLDIATGLNCTGLPYQTVTGASASSKPKVPCDPYIGSSTLTDVWYNFVAESNTHTITVDPDGSSLRAVIGIYNSCGPEDVTPLSCVVSTGEGAITLLGAANLVPGNKYYVRVYNYGGATDDGGFKICITNPCVKPGAPERVVVTTTTDSTATVSWSAGTPSAAGTVLYRWVIGSTASITFANGIAFGTTTESSIKLEYLACGFTYYFRVQAVSTCNDSASVYTSAIDFKMPECSSCTTPGKPEILSAGAQGTTGVLSWRPGIPRGNGQITYYWVVGTTPTVTYGNGIEQGSTTETWAATGPLLCGRNYYMRVFAQTSCDSSFSDYATSPAFFTIDCDIICGPVYAPVDLTAAGTSSTTANLSWSASGGSQPITYYWVIGTTATVTYGNGVVQGATTQMSVTAQGLTCGTTYYLRLFAYNSCSKYSSEYSTSTPFNTEACLPACKTPGAPGNPVVNITAEGIANISWTTPTDPGSDTLTYHWVIGESPSVTFNSGVAAGSTTGTSAQVSGLTCGKLFYLRVLATTSCDSTSSQFSEAKAFAMPNCPVTCVTPAAPINVYGMATSSSTADIGWTPGTPSGTDTVIYHWMIGKDPEVTFSSAIAQGATSSNSVSVTGLDCQTTYFLTVYAQTSCDQSKSSPTAAQQPFTTGSCSSCVTPPPPVNLTAESTRARTAKIAWQPGSPVVGNNINFRWVVGTTPDVEYGSGKAQGIGTSTSAFLEGLDCDSTYYFRVAAVTTCDWSSSEYATSGPFKTLACTTCETPAMPINVKVLATSGRTASMTWSAGSPAGTPNVYYRWVIGKNSDVNFGEGVIEGSGDGRSALVEGLQCDSTYYFRVAAYTTCDNSLSALTTPEVFTMLSCSPCVTPGTPTSLKVTLESGNRVHISWKAGTPTGTSTIQYHYVIGTSPNVVHGQGIEQGSLQNTSTYSHELRCGTAYYVRVFATTTCDNTASGYATSDSIATASCMPACITPGSPTNVSGTATGFTTANLSWSAGTPAGSDTIRYYWVVGKTASVTYGNGISQGVTSDTTITTSSLQCGGTYYLRVAASTNCNQSSSLYASSPPFTTPSAGCITAVPTIPGIEQVVVAPNPASSNIHIKLKLNNTRQVGFRLVDAKGNTVYYKPAARISGTLYRMIPVERLPAGLYLLQLFIDSHFYTEKIVVAR